MATVRANLANANVDTTHPQIEYSVNFEADAPCLLEFENEVMFNRKYVMLQEGSNVLPYFEGEGQYYEYSLKMLNKALADFGRPPGHDVPVPHPNPVTGVKTQSIAAKTGGHDVPIPRTNRSGTRR